MYLTRSKTLSALFISFVTLTACSTTDNIVQTPNTTNSNITSDINQATNPNITPSITPANNSNITPSINLATNSNITPRINPTNGEILVSPYNFLEPTKGLLQILDASGKEIKSKVTKGSALNFQKWNIDGQTRYTYVEYDPSLGTPFSTSNIPGSAVIMDENLNELKRVRLLPFRERTVDSLNNVDAHDFILLGDNHYVVMSYYLKEVDNIPAELNPSPNPRVIDAVIQEIQDDNVIFEWDSTDYPELYSASVESNNYTDASAINDYVHMNSMFIDPTDGNLICSFRNLSQVLKIDRKLGNIIWKLGGINSDFPLTENQRFYFQHDATLTDDNKTLLLFDNGSLTIRPYSRIVEFQLDELNKKVNSFKALNAPDNIFTMYMGSVQKRGDTYFIGWGSVPRMTEINYKTNEITFDMKLAQNSYRAFKY